MSNAEAPVTITARICAMLRLSQSPSSISKGMSTNMDKKFIFIIIVLIVIVLLVDKPISTYVSRLQQQQQYQCKCAQQEYECVLLDASASYLVAGGVSAPGKEIEEAIHHMTVPPGYRAADTTEDDAVGELVDFIEVEAVIGSCP